MPAAGSGCSVAWLARLTGGQEVASSNLAIPTIFISPANHTSFLAVNADRIEHFRERLQQLACEISADLAANKDDAGIVELDTSIGRLSRMDAMQNQQMALEMRRRRENQLLRIDNAFKRMDQGRYGKCGKCGKPIDEARLEVFPDVVSCVSCA